MHLVGACEVVVVVLVAAIVACRGDWTGGARNDASLSCYVCDDCPETFRLDGSLLVSCADEAATVGISTEDVAGTSMATTTPITTTTTTTTTATTASPINATTLSSPFSGNATTVAAATTLLPADADLATTTTVTVTVPSGNLTTVAPDFDAFVAPQIDDIGDHAGLLIANVTTVTGDLLGTAAQMNGSAPFGSHNATTSGSDLLAPAEPSIDNANGTAASPANGTALASGLAHRGRRSIRQLTPTHHCYVIEHRDVLSGALKVHRGCVRHNATAELMCAAAAASLPAGHQPDNCRICDRDGCNSCQRLRMEMAAAIASIVMGICAAWLR